MYLLVAYAGNCICNSNYGKTELKFYLYELLCIAGQICQLIAKVLSANTFYFCTSTTAK